jgi:galactose mutarotase-like enzyme
MEATFVPELGLLGASVRFEGDEFLSLHGGLDAVRGGHTTGIPLLHPWANRLSEMSYESEGTRVDLNGLDLHTDANGLPIHGTMVSAAGWELTHVEQTRAAASARMRFDFGARDDLLASFPFPHEITTEITVDGALSVATTLRPTGDVNVPVAFGYHPYFRIPRVPRRSLTLRLPARQHVILDDRGIPNGESELEPAEYEKLGDRSFDDQYALGDDRRLQLESGSRRITLAQQENYP